jgi:RNA polymerase sigma-70 factor (ECF subfamily)
LTQDREVAEDLTQETFLRAWRSMDQYREQGKERAYLLRIADRLARDRLRRLRRAPSLPSADVAVPTPDPIETPLETMTRLEEAREVRAALATLTDPQRRTLLLRYYAGMSFAEISEAMEAPLNTVLSHARRGLEALRRRLVENVP